MNSPYVRSQLPGSRHIRLLRVFADKQDGSGIRCHFSVVDLDNPPFLFTAISYVWGDSTLKDKAWFDDGISLEITASAGAVLRSIIKSSTYRDMYLWIDTLCINQQDFNEKSLQVQLMYDIYSSAEMTIAWTGEASHGSDIALDFTIVLADAILELLRRKIPITLASLSGMEGCHFPSPNWDALRCFLERPCFQRIWIVQEMTASRAIRLVCGNYSTEWHILAWVITIIMGHGLRRLIADFVDHQEIVSPIGAEGLVTMYSVRHLAQEARNPPTLSWLLTGMAHFGATDPRDRIFALVSISSNSGAAAFKPDYRKSVEGVYIDSTAAILTEDAGQIGPLYAAGIGHRRNYPCLPSWVPDWTARPTATILGAAAETRAPENKGFQACGTEFDSSSIAFDAEKLFIKIDAKMIDKVCFIASPAPKPTMEFEATRNNQVLASQFSWLMGVLQLLSSQLSYPTGEPAFPNVLCRTLVADLDAVAGSTASRAMITNFLDYFSVLFFFAKEMREVEEAAIPQSALERIQTISTQVNKTLTDDQGQPLPVDTLKAQCGEPPYLPKDVVYSSSVFSMAMSSSLGERRVIMTLGGYIGLAPPLVQVDDLLYLISGSRVPFILRKRTQDGYLLVGESYVHGLMYGEGRGSLENEEIRIY